MQTELGDFAAVKSGGDELSTAPKLLALHDRRCHLQKRDRLSGKVWAS